MDEGQPMSIMRFINVHIYHDVNTYTYKSCMYMCIHNQKWENNGTFKLLQEK